MARLLLDKKSLGDMMGTVAAFPLLGHSIVRKMLETPAVVLAGMLSEADSFVREVCGVPPGAPLPWEVVQFAASFHTPVQLLSKSAEQEAQLKHAAAEQEALLKHEAAEQEARQQRKGEQAMAQLVKVDGPYDVRVVGLPLRVALLQAVKRNDEATKLLSDHRLPEDAPTVTVGGDRAAALVSMERNFGWMLEAGEALVCGSWEQWAPAAALLAESGMHEGHGAPQVVDPADSMWSDGCRPVGCAGERLLAVVLRVPITQSMPFYVSREKTALATEPLDGMCVQPWVAGFGRVVQGSGVTEPLEYSTLTLTPQRMTLLIMLSRVLTHHTTGLCLTAPHGTGKSACMRFISLLLGIGAGGDVMYIPNAKALAPGEGAKVMLKTLLEGSLVLSCGMAVRSKVVSQAFIDLHKNQCSSALRVLLGADGAFCAAKDNSSACLLVDEMNGLQGALQSGVAASSLRPTDGSLAVLHAMSSWQFKCKRLFAYSPDFNMQVKLDFSSSRDDRQLFLELDGASTPTLLALALSPGGTEGRDLALTLPPARQQLCSAHVSCRGQLASFIASFGGVVRPLMRLASTRIPGAAGEDEEGFAAALRSELRDTIREMGKRCAKNWITRSPTAFSTMSPVARDAFFNKGLAASSLMRRSNRMLLEVEDKEQLRQVGPVSEAAFLYALRHFVEHLSVLDDTGHALEMKRAAKLLHDGMWAPLSEHSFEDYVVDLLRLGICANTCSPLSASSGPKDQLLAVMGGMSGTSLAAWDMTAVLPTSLTTQSGQPHAAGRVEGMTLPLALIARAKCLARGQRVVMQTSSAFPKCDAVLVQRSAKGNNADDEVTVVFMEVTSSPLASHGKPSSADRARLTGHQGKRVMKGHGAVWDLLGLTAMPDWKADTDTEAGVLRFQRTPGSDTEAASGAQGGPSGSSIANLVLDAVCPGLSVDASIQVGGPECVDFGSLALVCKFETVPSTVTGTAATVNRVVGRYCGAMVHFRVFFVYCTSKPQDVKIPDGQIKSAPGYFGVLGDGFVPSFLMPLREVAGLSTASAGGAAASEA